MSQVIIDGETISQQDELEKLDGDEYLILQKGSENKKIKTDKLIDSKEITNVTEIFGGLNMTQIRKLTQNGQVFAPATTSDAVVDANLQVATSKLIEEINVSKIFPAGGTDGTNKYTLETAIAKIPTAYRTVGVKCSFLDDGGILETWEYLGGTFTRMSSWGQVGTMELLKLHTESDFLNGYKSIVANETFDKVNGGYISSADIQRSDLFRIIGKVTVQESGDGYSPFKVYTFSDSSLSTESFITERFFSDFNEATLASTEKYALFLFQKSTNTATVFKLEMSGYAQPKQYTDEELSTLNNKITNVEKNAQTNASSILDKNASTYLKNLLKLDENWTSYQGNSSYENGVCTFQSTGNSANVNTTIEIQQGYNSIYLGGIIDTQGNTTTQYIQCLIYRKGIASPSTRELSVIKNNANEFTYGSKFTFDEEIEKITFRYRIGESNKTVLFKNPIAVLLSNINDLELGDYFEGTKDFYSDYSKEAGHSQTATFAENVSENSSAIQSKADSANLPQNLVISANFSDESKWVFQAVTNYNIENGRFHVNKVSNDNGIIYQNTSFEEQNGNYIYCSGKLKSNYSLTNDTYFEVIVYYNDETYNTLTANSSIGTDDEGYYLFEVSRAITKPVTHAIFRIRLKNLSSYENVGVVIKEPFMAVISNEQFNDIYNGNCVYYLKRATPYANIAIKALNAGKIDLEQLFSKITPLAGKKLLTLGDSITFGKKWQPQLAALTGMAFLENAVFTEYADDVSIQIQHLSELPKTVTVSNYPIGEGETGGIKNVATAIGGSSVRAVATPGSTGTEVDGNSAIVDGVSYNVGVAPGESLYERSKYVHIYEPDIIIVMGGQNDGTLSTGSSRLGSMDDEAYQGGYILQSEYDLLETEEKKKYSFYAMYKGMLLNLIKNNPKASIYCCGVMRCLRKQYNNEIYDEEATINYFYNNMLPAIKVKNAAIKEIAEFYGCKYIDLEGLSINPWNNTEWSSDTGDLLVHPNVERGNMMAISISNQL